MATKDEALPVRLLKHPTIWAGTGMLIRYWDDPSTSGTIWKGVGLISIAAGIALSLATRPAVDDDELR